MTMGGLISALGITHEEVGWDDTKGYFESE